MERTDPARRHRGRGDPGGIRAGGRWLRGAGCCGRRGVPARAIIVSWGCPASCLGKGKSAWRQGFGVVSRFRFPFIPGSSRLETVRSFRRADIPAQSARPVRRGRVRAEDCRRSRRAFERRRDSVGVKSAFRPRRGWPGCVGANSVCAARRVGACRSAICQARLSGGDAISSWRSYTLAAARWSEFHQAVATAEIALVLFAGYGIEVDQCNFLVPTDARRASDRDIRLGAVPLGRVIRSVAHAARLGPVILDVCWDNPFAARMQRGTATRPSGVAVPAPSRPGRCWRRTPQGGTVASDGRDWNSPYGVRPCCTTWRSGDSRWGSCTARCARSTGRDGRPEGTLHLRIDVEPGRLSVGSAAGSAAGSGRSAVCRGGSGGGRSRRDGPIAGGGEIAVPGVDQGQRRSGGLPGLPGTLLRRSLRGLGLEPPAPPRGGCAGDDGRNSRACVSGRRRK